MNMEENTAAPAVTVSAETIAETRPLYWSVKRELWENRSIYIAPLIVGGLVLFGFIISAIGLPQRRRALLLLDPTKQQAVVEQPYDFAAMLLLLTAFLVGAFYCLDALHGERRDRSILFWKSLPVSDFTTVLSKALIPLLVLPLLTFVIILVTQFFILLISTAILLPSGLWATSWDRLPFLQMSIVLLYGMVTLALWHAPIYGWLLLVSGWVPRATFLAAVLPWLAACGLEKIAFNTNHLAAFLGRRIAGNHEAAFVVSPQPKGVIFPVIDRIAQLDPLKFLSNPGLWLGLLLFAAFLVGASRLRRYHGPL